MFECTRIGADRQIQNLEPPKAVKCNILQSKTIKVKPDTDNPQLMIYLLLKVSHGTVI